MRFALAALVASCTYLPRCSSAAGLSPSCLLESSSAWGPDGAVAVPSGSDRADFIFLTKDQLGRRYPGVSLAGLPERGGAGLVVATSDLAQAETAVGSSGVRSGAAVCVAPAAANGTLLAFVKA